MNTKLATLRRSLALGAIALAFSSSALATPAYVRPALTDDATKLSYLAYIREHIPFLFEEVASYNKDILELLDAESNLMEKLKADTSYKRMDRARKDLVQFKIETLEQGRGQVRQLNEGVSASWKAELESTIAEKLLSELAVAESAEPKTAIKEALDSIIPELVRKSPSGIITGLINSLPRESRGAAFKLSQAEQLEFLARNLSEEEFRSNFRAANFGLDAENLTRSDVLALAERMLRQEKQAIELAKLAVIATRTGAETVAKLRSKIAQADSALLEQIVEPKAVEKALSELTADSAWKKLTAGFAKTAESSFKPFYSSVEGNVPVVGATYTLREMPPNLALFRGFIGGDCSTSYSYGFAYVPTERYFFLYNEEGKLRGYIGATQVKVGGKKTLYIHDGTGKYMSPKDLKTVFHALYQAREQLGVQKISLAVPDVISGNSHFPALVQAFNETTGNREKVTHVFSDEGIRKIVTDNGSSTSYDGVDRNQKGILMEPTAEQLASVRVEMAPSEAPEFTNRALTPAEALTLGFDFQKTRPEAAQKAFELAGMNAQEVAEFKAALQNTQRLPLAEYYAGVGDKLARFGIELTPEFRAKRIALFSAGHLRASDAFTTADNEYRKFSVNSVIEGLDAGYNQAGYAEAVEALKNNLEALKANSRVQKALGRLLENGKLQNYSLYYLVASSSVPVEVFGPEHEEALHRAAAEGPQQGYHKPIALNALIKMGKAGRYVDDALSFIANYDQSQIKLGFEILNQAESMTEAQISRLKVATNVYGGQTFEPVKLALLHKFGATAPGTETALKAALQNIVIADADAKALIKAQLEDLQAQPEDGSRTDFFNRMMEKLQAAAPGAKVKSILSADERKDLGRSVKWGLKSARTRDQAKRVKEALRARHTRAAR